jgi:hypothetical protein
MIYSRHEPQRPLTHSRCLILLFYGFRNEGTINCDKNSIRNVGYSVKLTLLDVFIVACDDPGNLPEEPRTKSVLDHFVLNPARSTKQSQTLLQQQ